MLKLNRAGAVRVACGVYVDEGPRHRGVHMAYATPAPL